MINDDTTKLDAKALRRGFRPQWFGRGMEPLDPAERLPRSERDDLIQELRKQQDITPRVPGAGRVSIALSLLFNGCVLGMALWLAGGDSEPLKVSAHRTAAMQGPAMLQVVSAVGTPKGIPALQADPKPVEIHPEKRTVERSTQSKKHRSRNVVRLSPPAAPSESAEVKPATTSRDHGVDGKDESPALAQAATKPSGGGPDFGMVVAGPSIDLSGVLTDYVARIEEALRGMQRYPAIAVRARLEGRVVLEIVIAADGRVVTVAIIESSGHSVLDRAALAAVKTRKKLPMPPDELSWNNGSVRVPFVYRLRNRGG